MTLTSQQLARLAGLSAGRYPAWPPDRVVDAAEGPPSTASAGVYVGPDVVAAVVEVALTDDPARPSAWVSVDTVIDSTSYTFGLDGETYTYTSSSPATLTEILEGLRDDVLGDAVHLAQVVGDELRVWRVNGAHPAGLTPGSELSGVVDATAAEVVVWMRGGSEGRWCAAGGDSVELSRSYVDLWRVSPLDRVAVQVLATDGRVRVRVAPCLAGGSDPVPVAP